MSVHSINSQLVTDNWKNLAAQTQKSKNPVSCSQ
jgi:hypothetical protein